MTQLLTVKNKTITNRQKIDGQHILPQQDDTAFVLEYHADRLPAIQVQGDHLQVLLGDEEGLLLHAKQQSNLFLNTSEQAYRLAGGKWVPIDGQPWAAPDVLAETVATSESPGLSTPGMIGIGTLALGGLAAAAGGGGSGGSHSEAAPAPTPTPTPTPTPNADISISGTAKVGHTLTAVLHEPDGFSGNPGYQWFADGRAIPGATGPTHSLSRAEQGKNITVQAGYTDHAGTAEQPLSTPAGTVLAAKESGLMLDIARHFYSPKVIKQYIDTIAKAGGTFLHLHLSGNENYALESQVLNQRAADAVRDSNSIYTNPKTGQPFLSFAQLQDIVQHAKAQGVELIPEIDSPAHMGGIFALLPPDQVQIIQSPVIANQIHYTEPRAITFIQSLIGEVAGRFGDSSRHFHIGGDEFGYSVANHHEFVAYANQLSGYLKTLGLTPRMWNDGVIKSALPQFDSNIQITYWDYDGFMDNASADPAQIAARRAVRADMPELAEAGFDVLNYNSYYLYATPDSGNGATSEPGNFAERDILKNWHLGVWDSNNHANAMTDSSKIAGAALAIWGEHAGTLSDETVFRYTAGHLDAVIRKTNAAADSQLADTIAAESANGFYQLNQEAYLDFGHIADNAVVDLRYNGKQTLHLLQEELLSDHSALDIWVRADTRHDTRGDGVVLNRHWQKTAQTDSRGSGWEQENYTAYEYRGNKLWLDDDIVITWI